MLEKSLDPEFTQNTEFPYPNHPFMGKMYGATSQS